MGEELVPPALLARLKGLDIALRRALPSSLRGDRKSARRRGISIEFADHRGYVPGDDVRHLDWAAFGRLDQLVLKLYHDEEDLQLHLLVDDSASMAFGTPAKARFARQLAAVFAWIGAQASHRVTVALLQDRPDVLVAGRDAGAFVRLVEHLSKPCAESRQPVHQTARAYATMIRPRGAVVLISDLFDPSGPAAVLAELQRPDTEVSMIQVFAEEEIDPVWDDDFRFIDSETGELVDVSTGPSILEAYRKRAKGYVSQCAETARGRAAAFAFTKSTTPIEDFVLKSLLEEGLLQ